MEPAPIEQLALSLSQHLDGHDGVHRLPDTYKSIDANTDLEAVLLWLSKYQHVDSTFRRYRSAANQLLNWSLVELKKPLSSLNNEEIQLYCQFLRNPAPRERWVSSHIKNDIPNWRPFKGPLTTASINNTLATLRSLMSFLRRSGYCDVWYSLNYVDRHALVTANRTERMPGTLMWETFWADFNKRLIELSSPDGLPVRLALQLTFYCCLDSPTLLCLDEAAFKRVGKGFTLTITERSKDRIYYLAPPIVETLDLMAKGGLVSTTFGSDSLAEREIFGFTLNTLRARLKTMLGDKLGVGGSSKTALPSLCTLRKWGKAHAEKYGDKMWQLIGVATAYKNPLNVYLPERRQLSDQEVEVLYRKMGL